MISYSTKLFLFSVNCYFITFYKINKFNLRFVIIIVCEIAVVNGIVFMIVIVFDTVNVLVIDRLVIIITNKWFLQCGGTSSDYSPLHLKNSSNF